MHECMQGAYQGTTCSRITLVHALMLVPCAQVMERLRHNVRCRLQLQQHDSSSMKGRQW